MKHTEKYVLKTLKSITESISNDKFSGNKPPWNLTINDINRCKSKGLRLLDIIRSILQGCTWGEVLYCEGDSGTQTLYWTLKIDWKLYKEPYTCFEESEISDILTEFEQHLRLL